MNVCNEIMPFLRIIAYLLKIVQWAVPMLLIVMVTVDFVKGISSSDEKNMEKAKSLVGKRLIYAVVIFLVPVLVRFMFRMLGNNFDSGGLASPTSWISCFNKALNNVK